MRLNVLQSCLSQGRCVPLGCYQQVLQGTKSLLEHSALLGQRHHFSWLGTHSEIVSLFIKRLAKSTGRVEIPKATHRVVSLFDTPMVLFHSVIRKLYEGKSIGPVHDFATQDLTYCPRVGVVSIGGHSLWSATGHFLCLLEELPG